MCSYFDQFLLEVKVRQSVLLKSLDLEASWLTGLLEADRGRLDCAMEAAESLVTEGAEKCRGQNVSEMIEFCSKARSCAGSVQSVRDSIRSKSQGRRITLRFERRSEDVDVVKKTGRIRAELKVGG